MIYITDINNNKQLKENCHKFKDGWYVKNKDCAEINGKWYRLNKNKNIIFNHTTNTFVFKTKENLINGIVNILKDGTKEYGYFSVDLQNNVKVKTVNGYEIAINHNTIKDFYTEKLDLGIYYPNTLTKFTNNIFNKKTIGNPYSVDLNYKCDPLLNKITKYFDAYFKPFNKLSLEDTKEEIIYDYLDNITYGIEIETFDGKIPEDICFSNGLIPLKDGSLRRSDNIGRTYLPYEYSTIILKGKKGLQAINNISFLLNKYCIHTHKESLHIHIGNIPVSKEYVISIYNTIQNIQDEMYSMFPEILKNTGPLKGKDYCNPIKKFTFTKDIDYNFNLIYNYFLGSYSIDDHPFRGFGINHPADPNNAHKWNISRRYRIVNFIPLIFNKQQTVEFRIHPSTFDKDSISYWLFLLNAIVMYSFINKDNELPKSLTLLDIIECVYKENDFLIKNLNIYIESCKKDMLFKKSNFGDTIGEITNINWKNQVDDFKKLI